MRFAGLNLSPNLGLPVQDADGIKPDAMTSPSSEHNNLLGLAVEVNGVI